MKFEVNFGEGAVGVVVTLVSIAAIGGIAWWAVKKDKKQQEELQKYKAERLEGRDISGEIEAASVSNEVLTDENRIHAAIILRENKAEMDNATQLQEFSDAYGKLTLNLMQFKTPNGNVNVGVAWSAREEKQKAAEFNKKIQVQKEGQTEMLKTVNHLVDATASTLRTFAWRR